MSSASVAPQVLHTTHADPIPGLSPTGGRGETLRTVRDIEEARRQPSEVPMTDLQPNQFVERATAELEKLVNDAREGARSAEELVTGSIENLQQLVEDLVEWVTEEIDKVRSQAD